jgi:hypothetical protein
MVLPVSSAGVGSWYGWSVTGAFSSTWSGMGEPIAAGSFVSASESACMTIQIRDQMKMEAHVRVL